MMVGGSWRRAGAALLFGLGPLVSLTYLIYCEDSRLGIDRDFGVFWMAGKLAAEGDVATIFNPAAFRQALATLVGEEAGKLPFLYAPNSLLLFAPLSLLPPLTAMIVWLAATFSLMAVLLRAGLNAPRMMTTALLVCPASIINIVCGQNAYLSTGLLAGALLALERRPILAGILLGLLSYKPHFGLMLPFLLLGTGHLRTFIAAGITTLMTLGVSIVFFGMDAWGLYLQAVTGQMGFLDRWNFTSYTFYMAFLRYGLASWLAALIHILVALFVTAATIWVFRRAVPHALKCSIAMVGVTLVAPYFLPYDMVIVSAAILLALPSFAGARWEWLLLALAWILPAFAFQSGVPAGPFLILALFLLLLRQAFQRGEPALTHGGVEP
ncbi:MAG: DUF2029 domain-containing protein [Proteobacteria bacterium]|nr:DUF2029 domain-containing protein [Pseudomonadota bacterium]